MTTWDFAALSDPARNFNFSRRWQEPGPPRRRILAPAAPKPAETALAWREAWRLEMAQLREAEARHGR